MRVVGHPRGRQRASVLLVALAIAVWTTQLPAAAAMPARVPARPINVDFQPGRGINDHGLAVGTVGTNGAHLAVYDTTHHTVTDFGAVGGFDTVTPNAINNAGVIAGEGEAVVGTTVVLDAFTYDTRTHTFTDLNALFGGDFSAALAINDHGLVGGAKVTRSDRGYHGVVVDPAADTVTQVPGLAGDVQSAVIDLNNTGLAVGASWATGPLISTAHGFVMDLVTDIAAPVPSGPGITENVPLAVNDAGLVVGPFRQASDAFVYDVTTGGLTDLGALAGDTAATATDINRQGQVVGESYGADFKGHAFVWTRSTNRLTPIGPDNKVTRTQSWEPTGINRHGKVVGAVFTPATPVTEETFVASVPPGA